MFSVYGALKGYVLRKLKNLFYKIQKENEEIFYICTFSGIWNGITAEPVVKYGVDMFIYEIGGVWKLSEAKSGLNILNAESKEAALRLL